MGDFNPRDASPECYREYLHVLARLRLGARLAGAVSASDIVHETILKAHKRREQFRGQNEAQYRAYLRQILANTIADHFRKQANEEHVRRALDASSIRMESWLQAPGRSPSEEVQHGELLLRLAEGMARLRPDERTALEMRYFQDQASSLEAIARQLNRRNARAVAGLLARGMQKLRDYLCPEESR